MTMHLGLIHKPLVRTDVFLSEFHRDSLRQLAKERDITSAELLRRILDRAIRRMLASEK